MSVLAKTASWVKHWTRIEPGFHELSLLRDEGDLDSLSTYVSEPGGTRGLRRRATMAIASMSPGGGNAGVSRPTDPAIIPILASLLEHDPDSAVRRSAAFGLRRTGDPAAAPALERALSSPDHATQIHGILGLGSLKCRNAIEPLLGLLDDPRCRRTAAEALVNIGDEIAIRPLWAAALAAESERERARLERGAQELEQTAGIRDVG
jgi:HEAT repeat protein